jgi:predicted nucleic acid-binding Zn ribbon protein
MPIYMIKCLDCNSLNEMIIKYSQIDDNNNVSEEFCPACGKPHLVKLPTLEGGSFQLKGKWFKTGGY